MRTFRPMLLVSALLLCTWFAVGIRQARDVTAATNIINTRQAAPRHKLETAAAALDAAKFLNPDQNVVDILRGRLAINRGQVVQARRILAVTRREPLNLSAWVWYTGANLGNRQAQIGAARIAELDPLDARVVGR